MSMLLGFILGHPGYYRNKHGMLYLVLILGIVIGITVKSWHESWSSPKENEHVVIRKFEYSSY